jgi:hypothetical protein
MQISNHFNMFDLNLGLSFNLCDNTLTDKTKSDDLISATGVISTEILSSVSVPISTTAASSCPGERNWNTNPRCDVLDSADPISIYFQNVIGCAPKHAISMRLCIKAILMSLCCLKQV